MPHTPVVWCILVAVSLAGSPPVCGQTRLTADVQVQATVNARCKVVFDRTAVTFDTNAYDTGTVVPVQALPLTVTAKARVPPHTRVVMTVQADGPFVSGSDTIPANSLSWSMTGPGFQAGGTANPHAPRTIGSWRGSGSWAGTQIYEFADSWNYAVGSYRLTMTYTIASP